MTAVDDIPLRADDLDPAFLRDEPDHVRGSLTALGRLLGAAMAQPPTDLTTFVRRHLGVPLSQVGVVGTFLRGVDLHLVQVALAGVLDRAPSAVLADDTGRGAPGYELVAVDVDEHVAGPDDLAAYVRADEWCGIDVVVVVTWSNGVQRLELKVRRPDLARARDVLSGLLKDARTTGNFYRGRTLEVSADDHCLDIRPVARRQRSRADVIQPERIWAEIDSNVTKLVVNGDLLASMGLGASRGVLLVGPPGVGKTALCTVISGELPPGTTIVLVDASVTARGLGRVYDSLPQLAPAAVFLDDIDLLAGDRRQGTGGPMLREFLTHLDGLAAPAPVLTVATTNAIGTIDPALVRPGRFDAVIDIGLPDATCRGEILRRLLEPLGIRCAATSAGPRGFDVLVARTDGASGADLREIVRRGVLERGTALTSCDLVELVATGRWRPTLPTGQYL